MSPHDDPGTEDELNAIEALAAAMWQTEGVLQGAGFLDADDWQQLEERIRQEYRDMAERWRDRRLLELVAAAEPERPR